MVSQFAIYCFHYSYLFFPKVMIAASYWSLLAPAIEMAEASKLYGDTGQWAFLPVAFGFGLGAAFVFSADQLMSYLVIKIV